MMANETLAPARVRVPGSTSNLGAGFDCVGLALNRHLCAEFEPGAGSLGLERSGTLAGLGVAEADDLLFRVFRTRLLEMGFPAPGGVLRVRSDIPVARGLGSSAAAVVAGIVLANRATRHAVEPAASAALLLEQASRWEGHPDNLAAAVSGGLVAVARGGDGVPSLLPLPLSDRIAFAFAAPPLELPTELARRALPAKLPHAGAAKALGRMAALLEGLRRGDPALLRIGFEDELHVPYRLPLIPRGEAAREAGVAAGAWAVTISGSGSGLIAVCPPGSDSAVAAAMGEVLAADGVPGVAFAVEPDREGLVREEVAACR